MVDRNDTGRIASEVHVTESRPTELLEALHRDAVPDVEHVFATRDAGPSDLVLVAWRERQALGYLAATIVSPSIVEVWEHGVVAGARHQGVGRLLLYELARRIPPSAIVRVDPAHQLDLQRVVDYYVRCGFTHVQRTGEVLATGTELLRSTGRSPAGGRGTPVSALLRSKDTPVVTIRPDATVAELVTTLNEHRIGAVPVSTDGQRVEGIVSERDVLQALGQGTGVLERRVHELMTKDTVTCTVTDGVELLMSLMTRLRVRHIPITEAGRLVGIVSLGDVVHHRLHEVEHENEQIREYISSGR